jgi:preprotein translocase subunit SecF
VDAYSTGGSSYRFVSTKSYEEVQPIIANTIKVPLQVTQAQSVGPTLGKEMTQKAIIALVVVILAILAFIAFSFREVSHPLPSWKYGVVAMVTLLHDIIVPTGVYVLLSHRYGAEVDTLFIIALLTIIGISISDKIVVFDRIRENLKTGGSKRSFGDVVGESLKQTFTRSINTSVTVVLALFALYFFGPSTTKYFTLTLIVGMVVGTYSSIFVASPLLTVWNRSK